MSRKSFLKGATTLVIGAAATKIANVESHADEAEYPRVTIEYEDELLQMAHNILMDAEKPYSDEQLKEIPLILNAKNKYF